MEIIIGNIKYETTQLKNGKWTLPEEIKKCLRSCCGAFDIDGNRVGTSDNLNGGSYQNKEGKSKLAEFYGGGQRYIKDKFIQPEGRYPAQTFINSETAQVLDVQSGDISGSSGGYNFDTSNNGNPSHLITNIKSGVHFADTGGCSKVLHKCDYEEGECDLYFYNPKVSKSERNAGCDAFQEVNFAMGGGANGAIKKGLDKYDKSQTIGLQKIHKFRNNHPTLKPIKLNKNILALFKTPNEQRIVYPFAGSGSEIIGGIKAGFNNWCGCEISQDYIDIALARIEYWSNFEGCEVPELQEVAEGQVDMWEII